MRYLALIAVLLLAACNGHYAGGFAQGLNAGTASARGGGIYAPPQRQNCYTYPSGYGYSTYCY